MVALETACPNIRVGPYRDKKMASLLEHVITPIWVAIQHSDRPRKSGEQGLTYHQTLTPNTAES